MYREPGRFPSFRVQRARDEATAGSDSTAPGGVTSIAPPMTTPFDSTPLIAEDLDLPSAGVGAVARLLSEGATVPFIARYRKEATGGLDEVQIRQVEEKHAYYRDLEERRQTMLREIDKQGKLTDALRTELLACRSKTQLEDLYLPYKPKRRTRAIMARERGLEPLAERIWAQAAEGSPTAEAQAFVAPDREVPDAVAALSGARDIVAERIAEDADIRQRFRHAYLTESAVRVKKQKEYREQRTKFDDYADYEEPVARIPSHRFLAIRRGENEGVLRAVLELDWEPLRGFVLGRTPYRRQSPWAEHLEQAAEDAVKRLLLSSVQVDTRVELKVRSDREAVEIFAKNLRELLLAAPFGAQAVLGIDPGQRTGCKCAVVDATGKLLAHTTFNLVTGAAALERAKSTVRDLCRAYPVRAVAVGNGTHGRETETFIRDLIREEGLTELFSALVNESGASVYSASDVAREEFPNLDLTVRGAISIARRLQDPLAEFVKIEPKSIGVGQYQHDVNQVLLERKLGEVVESCVNQVGVELNTASAPLLARVSGINGSLAKKIVAHRDRHGRFPSRQALLQVAGLGPRAFEQAAGFLRIRDGEHPLDGSAVHPERYELVERMARDLGVPVASLIGNRELLARIDRARYRSGDVGDFTLDDILAELDKPGRDPRASFEPPRFRDDIRTLEDLAPGMVLEGVVTNVTAFGAFVDVGVHQDGLVHVSQLADRFVKNPSDVVKVGDRLQVRVLEVDHQRRRISLSARQGTDERPRTDGPPPAGNERTGGRDRRPAGPRGPRAPQTESRKREPGPFSNNPFARHFKK